MHLYALTLTSPPRRYSAQSSLSVTFLSNCHFLTPRLRLPPSCFLWLSHFISYVPVFVSPLSSSPSPCCHWHCWFPAQVEQHSALLCFCLNDLTSNVDRPRFPSPPSLPSPLPSSSPCFLTASFSSSFFSCSLPHHHVFPSSPRLAPPLSPFPLHPLLHNLRDFPQGLHLVAMVTKGPPNSNVLSCEG